MLLSLLILLVLTISCSKDDSASSTDSKIDNLKIVAKATYSGGGSRGARQNSVVTISEFKINLKEIEFKLDDNYYGNDDNGNDDNGNDDNGNDDNGNDDNGNDDNGNDDNGNDDNGNHHSDDHDSNHDGYYGDEEEIELRGPFEIDLLSGQTTITSLNLPNGSYEEVEFKMNRNRDTSSTMYNKSIQIQGTIDGVPFLFWHNVEEKFEIDYHDLGQSLVIADNTATIVFDFNLDAILASVDLSVAVDGNGDGVIEISPNDPDGNQNLAHLIKNKIKEFTDLLDD